jgi:acetyl esterase/lipase
MPLPKFSNRKVPSMKPPFFLALAFLLTSSLPAQEPTPKTFLVETKKAIPYVAGKDADPVRHSLDLYLPKGKKDFPVLFFIHGGGWTKGSKKSFAKHGTVFAGRGIGAVAINYRLSPQVQHPAQIQDVARAFAWTCRNIGKYGGRTDRIFVSGHSAGGHLAALLATDDRYLKAEELALDNIRGAIPISGVYRLSPKLARIFGDEEACRLASPLNHVEGRRPPFLFLYADKDLPSCDKQSKEMTDLLRKGKNEASYLLVKDRNHGSIMGKITEDGDPAGQALLAFIAKYAE